MQWMHTTYMQDTCPDWGLDLGGRGCVGDGLWLERLCLGACMALSCRCVRAGTTQGIPLAWVIPTGPHMAAQMRAVHPP